MKKTISRDGTPIAFDRVGSGPALILVDGALCYRSQGPSAQMAAQLARHFTVFTYDRRGRGDSGNGSSYAIEREVEDIEELIREAGGAAFVYGVSSGAALGRGWHSRSAHHQARTPRRHSLWTHARTDSGGLSHPSQDGPRDRQTGHA